MVKLRIIVPTKNEEKFLPILSNSIKKQSFKDFEVVIADANSSDKTRKIAKSFGFSIVEGGHPAIGRNNGAKRCKAKILCFIDADIIIKNKEFLKKSIKEFEDSGLDIAGTYQKAISVKNRYKDFLYGLFYNIANLSMRISQKSKSPFMQSCMFVRTEVFRKLKGFPEYEFGEDSALAKNGVRKGYKFGILSSCGKVQISPRRLVKKGFFKMIIEYIYFNSMRVFGHEFKLGKTKTKYF